VNLAQTRGFATAAAASAASRSAARWIRRGKKAGTVTVVGGGWWTVEGWPRPVQGFHAVAIQLLRRGLIDPATGALKEGGAA
jgi:hypothetical protein